MRFVTAFSFLALAASGQCVVANLTTAAMPVDTTWKWVGRLGNDLSNTASAVAIGPHTLLSAKHVNGTHFYLDGVTYNVTASNAAPNVTNPYTHAASSVDLRILTVAETLPGFYQVGPGLAQGDTVTMAGFGNYGEVNAAGTGYNVHGPAQEANRQRHAGNNTADEYGFIQGMGWTYISYLKKAGDAVLGGQDSGGGYFHNGKLVGINSFIFNLSSDQGSSHSYMDYGFAATNTSGFSYPNGDSLGAGEAYFGSAAISLTDPGIQAWISRYTPVPEPASMLAVFSGLALMASRRRNRR